MLSTTMRHVCRGPTLMSISNMTGSTHTATKYAPRLRTMMPPAMMTLSKPMSRLTRLSMRAGYGTHVAHIGVERVTRNA